MAQDISKLTKDPYDDVKSEQNGLRYYTHLKRRVAEEKIYHKRKLINATLLKNRDLDELRPYDFKRLALMVIGTISLFQLFAILWCLRVKVQREGGNVQVNGGVGPETLNNHSRKMPYEEKLYKVQHGAVVELNCLGVTELGGHGEIFGERRLRWFKNDVAFAVQSRRNGNTFTENAGDLQVLGVDLSAMGMLRIVRSDTRSRGTYKCEDVTAPNPPPASRREFRVQVSPVGVYRGAWPTLSIIVCVAYLFLGSRERRGVRLFRAARQIAYLAVVMAMPGACQFAMGLHRNACVVLRHASDSHRLAEYLSADQMGRGTALRNRRQRNFLRVW